MCRIRWWQDIMQTDRDTSDRGEKQGARQAVVPVIAIYLALLAGLMVGTGTPVFAESVAAADTSAIMSPDSLAIVFNVNLTATLTWQDRSANETGFLIERMVTGGPWRTIGRAGQDTATFVDHNVQRDIWFFYRVSACNATDTSAYSPVDSVIEFSSPSISMTLPQGGETWYVGDTAYVDFTTQYVMSVAIFLSIDDGLTYTFMLPGHALRDYMPEWGHYPIVVPDWPSDSCIIELKEYSTSYAVYSGVFKIARKDNGVKPSVPLNTAVLSSPSEARLVGPGMGFVRYHCTGTSGAMLDVYAMGGARIASVPLPSQAGDHCIAVGKLMVDVSGIIRVIRLRMSPR
jgi:hypothetical protein